MTTSLQSSNSSSSKANCVKTKKDRLTKSEMIKHSDKTEKNRCASGVGSIYWNKEEANATSSGYELLAKQDKKEEVFGAKCNINVEVNCQQHMKENVDDGSSKAKKVLKTKKNSRKKTLRASTDNNKDELHSTTQHTGISRKLSAKVKSLKDTNVSSKKDVDERKSTVKQEIEHTDADLDFDKPISMVTRKRNGQKTTQASKGMYNHQKRASTVAQKNADNQNHHHNLRKRKHAAVSDSQRHINSDAESKVPGEKVEDDNMLIKLTKKLCTQSASSISMKNDDDLGNKV